MVTLDEAGEPVRDALLWNDTRSADAAADLIDELGGPQACADALGSVLVASFTLTKLRWLRDHEPANAERVAQVLLPHDYVSRHLCAPDTPAFTDRGDASGTGYFATAEGTWRPDLVELALGHGVDLPVLVTPGRAGGETTAGAVVAGGTGDNMGAALGMSLATGDVLVSVGTSGVASSISETPVADASGIVTGFADAAGGFLPMVTTINAAGILDLQRRLLDVDHDELSALALAADPGARGLTLLPYYGGERSPNRPSGVGTWHGLTSDTSRADLARAAYEALLCSLAEAVEGVLALTGEPVGRLLLVGGATRSVALRALAPAVLGQPVTLPPSEEYVALGAARQAAWALSGKDAPPNWPLHGAEELRADDGAAAATADLRATYARLRQRTADWS